MSAPTIVQRIGNFARGAKAEDLSAVVGPGAASVSVFCRISPNVVRKRDTKRALSGVSIWIADTPYNDYSFE